ncbi:TPA: RNA-binding S4 domain-containing protein [Candidatus Galligastranaerophilus intestinavium]|uniref:RQC P-site tRNA stabilizing factor n=1 Tax=Candidatus Galligastranaerophilus intestinavium TaxID=2840836 RepID=A0A9D1FJB6_9BACT|nr:RNA-binding S4 domain-containing protein [Candidatus Galligastranaerophilus intestinavium]
MRLDKFLKVSRLIKRRTVANSICESARVFVNDNPAKPAKVIKEGDIITIEFKDSIKRVRVLRVPSGNVSINEASGLYEILQNI